MISVERVLQVANDLYREARGYDMASEQVKALARALVEEINNEFERRDDYEREVRERAG